MSYIRIRSERQIWKVFLEEESEEGTSKMEIYVLASVGAEVIYKWLKGNYMPTLYGPDTQWDGRWHGVCTDD